MQEVFPTQAGQTIVTLEPLRSEGSDSLLPDAPAGIHIVKLSQVTTAAQSNLLETTTFTADDLFHSGIAAGKRRNLFPASAKILRAILTFVFDDLPLPTTVEISPPHTITYQHNSAAARVAPFLYKHRFITTRKIANLLCVLLAVAGALVPDLDDDDDDDPDEQRSHHHIHLPA
jgi:hypothetical protein